MTFSPVSKSDPSAKAQTVARALRVLIVEDSYLTARSISKMLQDLGAEIVGPAPSVASAIDLMDHERYDAAVLDINLGNETVETVAKRLELEGCPYFFVSGYASPKAMLQDPAFKNRRLLSKPVEPVVLGRAVAEEFRTQN